MSDDVKGFYELVWPEIEADIEKLVSSENRIAVKRILSDSFYRGWEYGASRIINTLQEVIQEVKK